MESSEVPPEPETSSSSARLRRPIYIGEEAPRIETSRSWQRWRCEKATDGENTEHAEMPIRDLGRRQWRNRNLVQGRHRVTAQ